MESLTKKEFSNRFTAHFPGDDSGDLSPRQTPGKLYSLARPTPVSKPKLLAWSQDLARKLKIKYPNDTDIDILAGNLVTPSMNPYANCYGGHQFGSWAGQLGDGRAISLGEWSGSKGAWEFQLKGAGPTPYSRRADGRAVLRSSVREYLASEAMHHLGVPTTRALSLVSTGDDILRDLFYDGHPAYEPGAIILRAAPSFLRFGSFELHTAREETALLQQLTDWTIKHYYPHIVGKDKVISWFREVIDKTAALMVEWDRVGFVHGVMNTDNMSIIGLTIDYGPYSFLDNYDPNFTPNTTDLPDRRYAFSKQFSVGFWNLIRLGSALYPLIGDAEPLEEALDTYENAVHTKYHQMMSQKLGLDGPDDQDRNLINKLISMLDKLQPDMTIFYRLLMDLSYEKPKPEAILSHFQPAFYEYPKDDKAAMFTDWIQQYHARRNQNQLPREVIYKNMETVNPYFIPRNYLLHKAIEELEAGSDKLFREIEKAIMNPYTTTATSLFKRRPDWATEKAGCSMLSCSS